MKKKIKLLFVVNDCHPLKYFLKEHIFFLNDSSIFEITVLLNTENFDIDSEFKGINIMHFNIRRKPNFLNDLSSLVFLIKYLSRNDFDIVHSVTPKSGLLLAIASRIVGVPIRLHTFTGQVWANYKGFKRLVFISIDKLICKLNNRILIDSNSQREYLIQLGVVSTKKVTVLGNGSICGVNLDRFRPKYEVQADLKSGYRIPTDSFVIVYIGRLNKDKGIVDLLNAFKKISDDLIFLFVIGNDEEEVISNYTNDFSVNLRSRFYYEKETSCPEKFMSLADLLCLPSYREGFGNVVIESAAVGTPALVSDIYGLRDSIISDITGITFEVGNLDDLVEKILYLKASRLKMHEMSLACISNIRDNFDSKYLTSCLFEFYQENIKRL